MEVSFPLRACSSVGNLRGDGLRYKTSAVTVKLDQRGQYKDVWPGRKWELVGQDLSVFLLLEKIHTPFEFYNL